MSWYQYWGNPIIATGIMAFVMHEVSRAFDGVQGGKLTVVQTVYFGRCLPWMIIDRIPAFNKWKLQEVRVVLNATIIRFADERLARADQDPHC